MCLLVAVSRAHADGPLIFAANRDEWLARPATAMEVLRGGPPRVLGGRDLLAGGTWLAVNDRGVVAALTNRPTGGERDPARRSRGEIPLTLAGHARARDAAFALAGEVRAEDYNPCWVLVGDRASLFYLDLTGTGRPEPRELPPGVHVLENQPIDAPSAKAARVRALVSAALTLHGKSLRAALWSVLSDHVAPAGEDPGGPPESALRAACVHAGPYGTRWSSVIRVPPEPAARPEVYYAAGRPCENPPVAAGVLWDASEA